MHLQRLILSAAMAGALGLAISSAAAAATIVHVGAVPPANPYFFITSGTPFSSTITANFGASRTLQFSGRFNF